MTPYEVIAAFTVLATVSALGWFIFTSERSLMELRRRNTDLERDVKTYVRALLIKEGTPESVTAAVALGDNPGPAPVDRSSLIPPGTKILGS